MSFASWFTVALIYLWVFALLVATGTSLWLASHAWHAGLLRASTTIVPAAAVTRAVLRPRPSTVSLGDRRAPRDAVKPATGVVVQLATHRPRAALSRRSVAD